MTEDEAKMLWCPYVRHTSETADLFASTNRGEVGTVARLSYTCIGSACMAWRWGWAGPDERSTVDGYCGLAGKP